MSRLRTAGIVLPVAVLAADSLGAVAFGAGLALHLGVVELPSTGDST